MLSSEEKSCQREEERVQEGCWESGEGKQWSAFCGAFINDSAELGTKVWQMNLWGSFADIIL